MIARFPMCSFETENGIVLEKAIQIIRRVNHESRYTRIFQQRGSDRGALS